MNEIKYLVKDPEPENLLQTPVQSPDLSKFTEVLPGSTVIYPEGKIIYCMLPKEDLSEVRQTILKAPTEAHSRLASKNVNGKAQRSFDTTFGYKPSRPVFGHSAGPVRYTIENPKGFEKLSRLGEKMEDIGILYLGKEFEDQTKTAKQKIRSEYLIGETGFTQGVINRSNQLNWHYDKGNYKESYSAMLWVLEGKIEGGELIIPSLKAYLKPIDGGILIFKGQNLIHGVGPIRKRTPGAERMSAVFYTIEAMEKALSQQEELIKSKEREFRKHFKNEKNSN